MGMKILVAVLVLAMGAADLLGANLLEEVRAMDECADAAVEAWDEDVAFSLCGAAWAGGGDAGGADGLDEGADFEGGRSEEGGVVLARGCEGEGVAV